jgi:formiminotetrahydrofolate cyclodeaminase
MIEDRTTAEFLDALASGAPTPGGGSAAAVLGAMGAALVSMVANLTIGKKGYEAVDAEMRVLLADAEALRAHLTGLVAQDVAAFDALMAAYRLPKATDDEKLARTTAIQGGLRLATAAPLACARGCAAAVRLAARAVEHGNRNVISDVGVGVLASWAGLRSAALNVRVNTPQFIDRDAAARAVAEVDALLDECGALSESVHARVMARLG